MYSDLHDDHIVITQIQFMDLGVEKGANHPNIEFFLRINVTAIHTSQLRLPAPTHYLHIYKNSTFRYSIFSVLSRSTSPSPLVFFGRSRHNWKLIHRALRKFLRRRIFSPGKIAYRLGARARRNAKTLFTLTGKHRRECPVPNSISDFARHGLQFFSAR